MLDFTPSFFSTWISLLEAPYYINNNVEVDT